MSNRMIAEVLKELYETTDDTNYSFLFASTTKSDDKIHVRANITDMESMNVALSILKQLSETYTVESILRCVEETLR